MKKTITNSERLQLLGLLTLAVQYQQKVASVEKGMAELLEHDDPYVDHLSDAIYEDNLDIDNILAKMQIEVTETTEKQVEKNGSRNNPVTPLR